MLKLICASTFVLIFSSPTLANSWKVYEGSTLLDGTVTATGVYGRMVSGKGYDRSSRVGLRCEDSKLLMHIVGDSALLTKEKAQESPTIEFIFKAGSKLATFKATIVSEISSNWARVHNGTDLLDFLRFYDGGSAKVQLPVARTGIPEVRRLSLKNFVKTTDLILATCGPLDAWEPVSAITKK